MRSCDLVGDARAARHVRPHLCDERRPLRRRDAGRRGDAGEDHARHRQQTGSQHDEPRPSGASRPRIGLRRASCKSNLRDYGMLLSLVAIMAFFQVMTDGTLLEPLNLTNLVLQNSYIVIMALGMLLVIVAGHIDLSVGSVVGFIGALAAVLMVQYEMALRAGRRSLCLVAGGAIGAIAGLVRRLPRIPSFIVTLAGMLVFKGLAWRCCRASRSGRSRRRSSCSARASSPTVLRRRDAAHRASLRARRRRSRPALVVAKLRAARATSATPRHRGRALRRSSSPRTWCSSALIVCFSLPAGLLQGPAQRADHHGAADAAVRLRHHAHHRSAGASTRSAATRRRRGCRASRPSG